MSRWFRASLAGAALLSCSTVVHAQLCHDVAWRSEDTGPVPSASLAGIVGVYDDALGRGSYQGLMVGAGMAQRGLAAQVSLPMYRLTDAGTERRGLGDLGVGVRATLLRSETEGMTLGLELGATLPTGAESASLGMGHTMLMPGAWWMFDDTRFVVEVVAAYGRALTDLGSDARSHAHEHHAATRGSPVVSPMNLSELEHSVRFGYRALTSLQAYVRWVGAEPIATRDGEAREIVGLGARVETSGVDASVELQAPVHGDPFAARGVVSLTVR